MAKAIIDRRLLLYRGARMALQTAHDWERDACLYDRSWAEKCLAQATECRARARDYLMRRTWYPQNGEHAS